MLPSIAATAILQPETLADPLRCGAALTKPCSITPRLCQEGLYSAPMCTTTVYIVARRGDHAGPTTLTFFALSIKSIALASNVYGNAVLEPLYDGPPSG